MFQERNVLLNLSGALKSGGNAESVQKLPLTFQRHVWTYPCIIRCLGCDM